jgi:cytochrome c oxidase cbb3-type subunit 1
VEPFVKNFIRSSLVWLGTGVLLGLWLVVAPVQAVMYRPAHLHANLLGFVSMMIFGVAYHVIPRFIGAPLWSRSAAGLHLWLANAGLALMIAGWMIRPARYTTGSGVLIAGAFLSAVGTFLFITNIWRTLAPNAHTRQPAPEVVQLIRQKRRAGS